MQITNNNFSKGINSDIEERYQGNDSYRDAENITITGEGSYLTATNISGSKLVSRIIDSSIEADYVNVLGAFECTGSYSSYGNKESNASILMFVYWETSILPNDPSQLSSIYLYDIVKDKLHLLLETNQNFNGTSLRGLDFPKEGTVDAVILGENGIDNIYFDDHKNVLRKLEITDTSIEAAYLLSHVRYAPIDTISFEDIVEDDGELGCGSYQFAYQYYNTETKKETTYSLFTNPIDIVPVDFNEDTQSHKIYGGVPNEVSRKAIKLKIDKNSEHRQFYNSIRLAVIKNTIGSSRANPSVNLTEVNLSWFEDEYVIYSGAGLERVVDLSEIVVDDAPINNAKTLTTKDGVLFRGNINYFDRKIEDVKFDSAETISKNIGISSIQVDNTKVNTNNPSFNNDIYRSDKKLFAVNKEIYNDEEVSPSVIRLIKPGVDVAAGEVSDYGTGKRNVANLVSWYTEPVRIEINNDLKAGNVFRFSLKGFFRGLSDGETLSDEFRLDIQDYHTTTKRWFNNQESNGKGFTYSPDMDFSYTVKKGDTTKNIVDAICDSIELNSSGFMDITRQDDYFVLKSTIPSNYNWDTGSFPNKIYKEGYWDIAFWSFKGIDTTILSDNVSDFKNEKGGYVNPINSNKNRGYFRDEVYRFGITYMDEFGNWSNPVPFNFSEQNIYAEPKSDAFFTTSIGNIDWSNYYGGVEFARIEGFSYEEGDLFRYEDSVGNINGVYLITALLEEGCVAEPLDFKIKPEDTEGGRLGKKIYSISSSLSYAKKGTDWKFPSRNNRNYSIFKEDGLSALGIKINGITNHPEWAKAYAIVRVRRLKDIVWQSPHITASAVMPSTNVEGAGESGSVNGTLLPKTFSKGATRNFQRTTHTFTTIKDVSSLQAQSQEDDNILPVSICVPPEYMYQLDNINFGSGLTPNSSKLKIVDAISLSRTQIFDIDGIGGQGGNGYSQTDRMALAFNASNYYNYYYGKKNGNISFDYYDFSTTGQFENGNDNNVIDFGEVTAGGTHYTMPYTPSSNVSLRSVVDFGNGQGVALYNNSPASFRQQKALVLTLDKKFGDLTYMSAIEVPGFTGVHTDFKVTNEIKFNEDRLTDNGFINVGFSSFWTIEQVIQDPTKVTGVENIFSDSIQNLPDPTNINGSNRITLYNNGTTATTPIVNLVRGIEDDRYGLNSDVLQYIHTGVYGVITSQTQSIDVEVFGGDCFISKHTVRTSETQFGIFSEKIQAYNDLYEVISCYVESTINCQLQSNPFVYPVRDEQTVGEFETDYTYPYNPGYSVENEAKTWTSLSLGDVNRTKFPARMIYSDQKIFQTDEEGFNRFRVSSLYDFPEEYGGLTKLSKVASDNVYVIQDEAVCVVPINKNVIEDASSNQMIINSSTLINKPQYFLNENGSQHIRSVINTDDTIIFMDAQKRSVIKIAGGQSERISDNGKYSDFHTALESNTKIPDKDIVAGYDFNNKEYFIGVNTFKDKVYNDGGSETEVDRKGFLYVWSDKINSWTTSIVPSEDTKIHSIVYSNSELYIIGNDKSNSLDLENFYGNSTRGVILGETVPSKITFVINPNVSFGKTFDNIRLDSNNRVDSCDMVVIKEDGTVDQEATMNCNVKPRHDAYEFPILRDSKNARLRGKYAITTFTINNGTETSVSIAGVITKYRTSKNNFTYGATR